MFIILRHFQKKKKKKNNELKKYKFNHYYSQFFEHMYLNHGTMS